MSYKEHRLLIGPVDGAVITNPIGGRMVIKLRDSDTSDAYSIHENVIPSGSPGPRAHIHRYHDEVFYVLEGQIEVEIGSETVTGTPGSFVIVPRGQVHRPSNPSSVPAKVLLIFSPAGMGNFFEEVARRQLPLQAIPTDPAVAAELKAFTEKYGYEFADENGDPRDK
jgi:mannose-6-phosphate isomerase-like protein (cupin superfamily)